MGAKTPLLKHQLNSYRKPRTLEGDILRAMTLSVGNGKLNRLTSDSILGDAKGFLHPVPKYVLVLFIPIEGKQENEEGSYTILYIQCVIFCVLLALSRARRVP